MRPATPGSPLAENWPPLAATRRAAEGGRSAATPPNFTASGKARSRLASTFCTVYFVARGSTNRRIPFGCSSSLPRRYRRQPRVVGESAAPRTTVWPWMRQTNCDISSISFFPMKNGVAVCNLPSAVLSASLCSGSCTAVSITPSTLPSSDEPRSPSLRRPPEPSLATPRREPCVPSSLSSARATSTTDVPSWPVTKATPKSHVLFGRLRKR
mmetsp:Transcript_68177/g.199484  ORF Transcript_68177/g.199484 Transcript_68177/m.199484 type:complete len:212 (+) Transcript_68177:793-1428(+)